FCAKSTRWSASARLTARRERRRRRQFGTRPDSAGRLTIGITRCGPVHRSEEAGTRFGKWVLGVAMVGYPDQFVEIEAVALCAGDVGTPDSGSVGAL
ncbi:MAG TPA: hypothetical protein VNA86_10140, partial [bacterium]|nr:hypothetical protein [bacterium]